MTNFLIVLEIKGKFFLVLLGLCITHYFLVHGQTASTLSFSSVLFINQLANHVTEKGRHGIQLVPGVMELFILLFSDDVALLSTTPNGLQNQLDCLKTRSKEMKMEVNKDKTKDHKTELQREKSGNIS